MATRNDLPLHLPLSFVPQPALGQSPESARPAAAISIEVGCVGKEGRTEGLCGDRIPIQLLVARAQGTVIYSFLPHSSTRDQQLVVI